MREGLTKTLTLHSVALHRKRGGGGDAGGGEGERESQSRVFALHVLKSLSHFSLAVPSHDRAMCSRHVTCRCRTHRSERAREGGRGRERASERASRRRGWEGLEEEKGRGGVGRRGKKWREMKRRGRKTERMSSEEKIGGDEGTSAHSV